MELILASASPRRKELLEKIGLPFTVQPAKGEERITQKSPAAVVMELSRQKAEEIAAAQTGDCIIIGADTVVAKGEKIMGKPKDAADAKQMLRSIADDCHQVYTGVTLIRTGAHPQSVTFQEKTDVFLYPISVSIALSFCASSFCAREMEIIEVASTLLLPWERAICIAFVAYSMASFWRDSSI